MIKYLLINIKITFPAILSIESCDDVDASLFKIAVSDSKLRTLVFVGDSIN